MIEPDFDDDMTYRNCKKCNNEFWDGFVGCRFNDDYCNECHPKVLNDARYKISKNYWRNSKCKKKKTHRKH